MLPVARELIQFAVGVGHHVFPAIDPNKIPLARRAKTGALHRRFATVSGQTKERVSAVLKGLKAQTTSLKSQLDEIDKELEVLKLKDIEATEKYRPYFRAKRDLELLQKMRDALKMRIINEKIEGSLPRL